MKNIWYIVEEFLNHVHEYISKMSDAAEAEMQKYISEIEEYKEDLDKQDIINILYYYYLFNKDIFDNIL